jgi:hypothetical protein
MQTTSSNQLKQQFTTNLEIQKFEKFEAGASGSNADTKSSRACPAQGAGAHESSTSQIELR